MSDIDSQINAMKKQLVELENQKKKEQEQEQEQKAIIENFIEASSSPANWEYYLPQESDFERMVDMNSDYYEMSFAEFLKWNIKIIKELSEEDRVWLKNLYKKIRTGKISMTDMEDCGIWDACGFYYDMRGRLCIMHPR